MIIKTGTTEKGDVGIASIGKADWAHAVSEAVIAGRLMNGITDHWPSPGGEGSGTLYTE